MFYLEYVAITKSTVTFLKALGKFSFENKSNPLSIISQLRLHYKLANVFWKEYKKNLLHK